MKLQEREKVGKLVNGGEFWAVVSFTAFCRERDKLGRLTNT